MSEDAWEFRCVLFVIIILAILFFVLGASSGLDIVYDEYCRSLEYDDSDIVNGQRYCVDNDNPEAIFYIEWQE